MERVAVAADMSFAEAEAAIKGLLDQGLIEETRKGDFAINEEKARALGVLQDEEGEQLADS